MKQPFFSCHNHMHPTLSLMVVSTVILQEHIEHD